MSASVIGVPGGDGYIFHLCCVNCIHIVCSYIRHDAALCTFTSHVSCHVAPIMSCRTYHDMLCRTFHVMSHVSCHVARIMLCRTYYVVLCRTYHVMLCRTYHVMSHVSCYVARIMLRRTYQPAQPSVYACGCHILRQNSPELPEKLRLALDNQQARRIPVGCQEGKNGKKENECRMSYFKTHSRSRSVSM
jgi:hypothetical protein